MDKKGPYDFKEGPNNNPTTLGEKLKAAGVLLSLPVLLPFWCVQYAFNTDTKLPFRADIFAKVSGHVTKSLTIRELRTIVPIVPARVALKSYNCIAQKSGFHNFNYYFGGANYSARWIHEAPDRKFNDPVLIYLHGGGYALKVGEPQITHIFWLAKRYVSSRVSILFMDYTVTPFARYPDQLKEMCALYTDLSKSCENIHIISDSCGSHLALQLLTHSANPIPGVDPVTADIKSLTLFSPWVGLDVKAGGSYIENDKCDIIDSRMSKDMQTLFCDDAALENPRVNLVLERSTSFWTKVLPKRVVVVWGHNEIFRDGIRKWCEIAEIKHSFEDPAGVHDAMLSGPEGDSTTFVVEFLDQWLTETV